MGKAYELDLDCEFGGVSIGDATARVGVKLAREFLELHEADSFFAGRRLECEISLLNRSDRDQKRLPSMEDSEPPSLESVADCKRYSVDAKHFGASLTFSLDSIDVTELAQFAKAKGTIRANVVGDMADSEGSDDDGEDRDEDDGPGTVTMKRVKGGRMVTKRTPSKAAVTPGDVNASQPLKMLAQFGMTPKKLAVVEAACGGGTIGHFETWMAGNEWWHRDLKGFGEEWITRLQDAHLAFRKSFPVTAPEEADSEAGTILDPEMAGA